MYATRGKTFVPQRRPITGIQPSQGNLRIKVSICSCHRVRVNSKSKTCSIWSLQLLSRAQVRNQSRIKTEIERSRNPWPPCSKCLHEDITAALMTKRRLSHLRQETIKKRLLQGPLEHTNRCMMSIWSLLQMKKSLFCRPEKFLKSTWVSCTTCKNSKKWSPNHQI